VKEATKTKGWMAGAVLMVITGLGSGVHGCAITTGDPGVYWMGWGMICFGLGVVLLLLLASEVRD